MDLIEQRARDEHVTMLLVVLLAAVWGALFLPALLRARQSTSPIVSVSMFRNSMRALSSGRTGRWVVMPLDPEELNRSRKVAIARRRKTFVVLLWISGATLILGLMPPLRSLLTVHLIADVVLAGFIGFLVWSRHVGAEEMSAIPEEPVQEEDPEAFEYLQASQF